MSNGLMYVEIPSPFRLLPPSSPEKQPTDPIQGLRGFASLLVVFTHICRAFDEELFKPTSAEGAKPRILQYPIIRILFQGRIGVTIFSLVTGYVCALKPLRQCRAGQQDAMFAGVARSAFRRVPRLILPTTMATTMIWFFCQFGVFEVGNRVNSWWVNYTSPNITPYIGNAVMDLIHHLITTWTKSWNVYDNNQWTLLPLLKGSMLVYMFLVATAFCKARYRMILELAMFVYYYISNDCESTICGFEGIGANRYSCIRNAILLRGLPRRSLSTSPSPSMVRSSKMAQQNPLPSPHPNWTPPRLLPRRQGPMDAMVRNYGPNFCLHLPQGQ